jgi:hypothetical protein
MLSIDSLSGVKKGQYTQQHLSSFHTTNRLPCDHGTSYFFLDEWNKWTHGPHKVSYHSILNIRHTDPSFVPQLSLVIFHKSRWLPFHGIALYLLGLLAFHLTFPCILEYCKIYFISMTSILAAILKLSLSNDLNNLNDLLSLLPIDSNETFDSKRRLPHLLP